MNRDSNNKKIISVIIPVFNRIRELRRALESLASQTYANFEVLICDDGSTDDIKSIVEEFSAELDIRYKRIEKSGGPARPRNTCLALAQGEWVSLLDSDDWWQPNRMEIIKNFLTADVDVVYHQLTILREQNADHSGPSKNLVANQLKHHDPMIHMLRFGNPLATSGTLVRTSALRAIGGFFDQIPGYIDDFDAWMNLAASGARFKYVPLSLGYYSVSDNNISKFSIKQYFREKCLFRRQLKIMPDAYVKTARSNFNYLLGSYALRLGMPGSKRLCMIDPKVEPLRWLKALLKSAPLLVHKRLWPT